MGFASIVYASLMLAPLITNTNDAALLKAREAAFVASGASKSVKDWSHKAAKWLEKETSKSNMKTAMATSTWIAKSAMDKRVTLSFPNTTLSSMDTFIITPTGVQYVCVWSL